MLQSAMLDPDAYLSVRKEGRKEALASMFLKMGWVVGCVGHTSIIGFIMTS